MPAGIVFRPVHPGAALREVGLLLAEIPQHRLLEAILRGQLADSAMNAGKLVIAQ
ncbi:hypothetical protein ABLE91_27975 [Aquabacter sp. CN5-332]|uniref:hypothetical protein n=1 Tax=Aquabacter sp. CN5-332 TaxID=3156608 RepID=UPI0032B36857